MKPKKNKSEALPALINKILEDGKASDILTIDLMGKTSLTDCLVIASGSSSRHVLALAGTLYEKLKERISLISKVSVWETPTSCASYYE